MINNIDNTGGKIGKPSLTPVMGTKGDAVLQMFT